jgi:NAD(P)-dependent dehydrogenase (short-subunit alcohol dehydrogenase family)
VPLAGAWFKTGFRACLVEPAARRVKRVAAEIASQEPRIDVLINNAGAIFAASSESPTMLFRNLFYYNCAANAAESFRQRNTVSTSQTDSIDSFDTPEYKTA